LADAGHVRLVVVAAMTPVQRSRKMRMRSTPVKQQTFVVFP